MSPYERFLRWYTGRQIPKPQPAQVTAWYPQDAPRRLPPVPRATVDEAFLVRGLAAGPDKLEREIHSSFGIPPARTESVIHDRDGNFLPGSP